MLPTVGGFSGFSVGKSEEIRSLCSDTSDVSGAIGWAVAIGKNLDDRQEDIRWFCDMLDGKFAGCVQQNWGVLLYFLDKVSLSALPKLFSSVANYANILHTHRKGGMTTPEPFSC